ncbi:hypothetical protein SeMB42_g07546 [Synchytrium endobioticum]|uniref:Uncharacterized protein n=1 Tax=Synchytrium endobioticum TaxID=286115 RepID=A0A507C4B3_9FUNG|nr:hypothetical protein SeMB42_g07546 [Synchytrium endobioticum]
MGYKKDASAVGQFPPTPTTFLIAPPLPRSGPAYVLIPPRIPAPESQLSASLCDTPLLPTRLPAYHHQIRLAHPNQSPGPSCDTIRYEQRTHLDNCATPRRTAAAQKSPTACPPPFRPGFTAKSPPRSTPPNSPPPMNTEGINTTYARATSTSPAPASQRGDSHVQMSRDPHLVGREKRSTTPTDSPKSASAAAGRGRGISTRGGPRTSPSGSLKPSFVDSDENVQSLASCSNLPSSINDPTGTETAPKVQDTEIFVHSPPKKESANLQNTKPPPEEQRPPKRPRGFRGTTYAPMVFSKPPNVLPLPTHSSMHAVSHSNHPFNRQQGRPGNSAKFTSVSSTPFFTNPPRDGTIQNYIQSLPLEKWKWPSVPREGELCWAPLDRPPEPVRPPSPAFPDPLPTTMPDSADLALQETLFWVVQVVAKIGPVASDIVRKAGADDGLRITAAGGCLDLLNLACAADVMRVDSDTDEDGDGGTHGTKGKRKRKKVRNNNTTSTTNGADYNAPTPMMEDVQPDTSGSAPQPIHPTTTTRPETTAGHVTQIKADLNSENKETKNESLAVPKSTKPTKVHLQGEPLYIVRTLPLHTLDPRRADPNAEHYLLPASQLYPYLSHDPEPRKDVRFNRAALQAVDMAGGWHIPEGVQQVHKDGIESFHPGNSSQIQQSPLSSRDIAAALNKSYAIPERTIPDFNDLLDSESLQLNTSDTSMAARVTALVANRLPDHDKLRVTLLSSIRYGTEIVHVGDMVRLATKMNEKRGGRNPNPNTSGSAVGTRRQAAAAALNAFGNGFGTANFTGATSANISNNNSSSNNNYNGTLSVQVSSPLPTNDREFMLIQHITVRRRLFNNIASVRVEGDIYHRVAIVLPNGDCKVKWKPLSIRREVELTRIAGRCYGEAEIRLRMPVVCEVRDWDGIERLEPIDKEREKEVITSVVLRAPKSVFEPLPPFIDDEGESDGDEDLPDDFDSEQDRVLYPPRASASIINPGLRPHQSPILPTVAISLPVAPRIERTPSATSRGRGRGGQRGRPRGRGRGTYSSRRRRSSLSSEEEELSDDSTEEDLDTNEDVTDDESDLKSPITSPHHGMTGSTAVSAVHNSYR